MRRSNSDLGGNKIAIVSISYTVFVFRNSEKQLKKKKNSSENKYMLIPSP